MKFFLQTSHKAIVFLLFFTVWTDMILPKQYNNSKFAFWIWAMFLLSWFYFAFQHLSTISDRNIKIKLSYNLALIWLVIAISLRSAFGFNLILLGYFNLICYIYLAVILTIYLLALEQNKKVNIKSIITFFMILILPLGAWWIHKRIQKVVIHHNGVVNN